MLEIDWSDIDADILAGWRIGAVQAIVKAADIPLAEALSELGHRYELLRRTRPEGFSTPHERYWDGFYS